MWFGNNKTRWDTLSPERQQRLSTLPGWTMDARAGWWEEGFKHLQDYTEAHRTCKLPSSKYVHNGFKLGIWVNTQRQNWANLTDDQRDRLSYLPGWVLNTKDAMWDEGFDYLLKHIELRGDAAVDTGCVFEGYKLGQWVTVQRSMNRKGDIKPDRFEKLDKPLDGSGLSGKVVNVLAPRLLSASGRAALKSWGVDSGQ